ncbi:MAG: VWA domain-containing protein [Elusimicrobiaceae bacterium]|nr:VWA domain-containing protein [Elusimicrobiaceae bacterium]
MELFANTKIFFYLILTALLIAFFWRIGYLRRKAVLKILFSKTNFTLLTSPGFKVRRHIKDILFLSGIFCLFIALAGLQWGKERRESSANYSQAIIAMDVSLSMQAEDFKPNRLENAKMMLRMLFEEVAQERLGLIAFTSEAYMLCPITTDLDALKNLSDNLRINMLPVAGTAISPTIKLASRMLSPYGGIKALVLVTDGEDHNPQDIEATLKIARETGIRIITVGIGTEDGELIPIKTAQGTEYKKDKSGKTVLTKLDEKSLINLASKTGGAYIKYTNAQQVAGDIANQLRTLDKNLTKTTDTIIYKSRYQIPLALAIILIMGALCLPIRKGKI